MVAGKPAERTETPPPPSANTAKIAEGAGVNLTSDKEAALFFSDKGKFERLLTAKKAADKALMDHGKEVKKNWGKSGLAAIKMAVSIGADDDALEEKQNEIALELKVMRWMGVPIGFQPDMFDQTDRRPADEIAFDRGKLAGMEGKGMKEFGYDESSPQWQKAAEGWHEGQKAIFNIKEPANDSLLKGADAGGKGKGKPGGVKSAKDAAAEAAAAENTDKTKH